MFTTVCFFSLIFILIFIDTNQKLSDFIYVLGAMAGGAIITIIGQLVSKLKKDAEPLDSELKYIIVEKPPEN